MAGRTSSFGGGASSARGDNMLPDLDTPTAAGFGPTGETSSSGAPLNWHLHPTTGHPLPRDASAWPKNVVGKGDVRLKPAEEPSPPQGQAGFDAEREARIKALGPKASALDIKDIKSRFPEARTPDASLDRPLPSRLGLSPDEWEQRQKDAENRVEETPSEPRDFTPEELRAQRVANRKTRRQRQKFVASLPWDQRLPHLTEQHRWETKQKREAAGRARAGGTWNLRTPSLTPSDQSTPEEQEASTATPGSTAAPQIDMTRAIYMGGVPYHPKDYSRLPADRGHEDWKGLSEHRPADPSSAASEPETTSERSTQDGRLRYVPGTNEPRLPHEEWNEKTGEPLTLTDEQRAANEAARPAFKEARADWVKGMASKTTGANTFTTRAPKKLSATVTARQVIADAHPGTEIEGQRILTFGTDHANNLTKHVNTALLENQSYGLSHPMIQKLLGMKSRLDEARDHFRAAGALRNVRAADEAARADAPQREMTLAEIDQHDMDMANKNRVASPESLEKLSSGERKKREALGNYPLVQFHEDRIAQRREARNDPSVDFSKFRAENQHLFTPVDSSRSGGFTSAVVVAGGSGGVSRNEELEKSRDHVAKGYKLLTDLHTDLLDDDIANFGKDKPIGVPSGGESVADYAMYAEHNRKTLKMKGAKAYKGPVVFGNKVYDNPSANPAVQDAVADAMANKDTNIPAGTETPLVRPMRTGRKRKIEREAVLPEVESTREAGRGGKYNEPVSTGTTGSVGSGTWTEGQGPLVSAAVRGMANDVAGENIGEMLVGGGSGNLAGTAGIPDSNTQGKDKISSEEQDELNRTAAANQQEQNRQKTAEKAAQAGTVAETAVEANQSGKRIRKIVQGTKDSGTERLRAALDQAEGRKSKPRTNRNPAAGKPRGKGPVVPKKGDKKGEEK